MSSTISIDKKQTSVYLRASGYCFIVSAVFLIIFIVLSNHSIFTHIYFLYYIKFLGELTRLFSLFLLIFALRKLVYPHINFRRMRTILSFFAYFLLFLLCFLLIVSVIPQKFFLGILPINQITSIFSIFAVFLYFLLFSGLYMFFRVLIPDEFNRLRSSSIVLVFYASNGFIQLFEQTILTSAVLNTNTLSFQTKIVTLEVLDVIVVSLVALFLLLLGIFFIASAKIFPDLVLEVEDSLESFND